MIYMQNIYLKYAALQTQGYAAVVSKACLACSEPTELRPLQGRITRLLFRALYMQIGTHSQIKSNFRSYSLTKPEQAVQNFMSISKNPC